MLLVVSSRETKCSAGETGCEKSLGPEPALVSCESKSEGLNVYRCVRLCAYLSSMKEC